MTSRSFKKTDFKCKEKLLKKQMKNLLSKYFFKNFSVCYFFFFNTYDFVFGMVFFLQQ